MNGYLYLVIHDTVAIISGTYLVCHGYPWGSAVCFFLAATTTVKALTKVTEDKCIK